MLLERLTEFDATVDQREARAVALEASAGVPIHEALSALGQLGESGDLLRLADGRATTRQHRAREQATLLIAQRVAAAPADPLPIQSVEREVNALAIELAVKGATLTTEQTTALELAVLIGGWW